MKKIALFLFSLAFAQLASGGIKFRHAGFVPRKNDSVMINIVSAFSFGSPGSCMSIDHSKTEQRDDTLFLSAYYNFGNGGWVLRGCVADDTVNVGIVPPDIKAIKVMLGVHDNTPDTGYMGIDTTLLVALDVPKVERNVGKYILYPSPVQNVIYIDKDLKYKQACIADLAGRKMMVIDKPVYSIDVNQLARGVYFIQLIMEEGVISRQFLKE